eukprot:Mrub_07713.p1 GENE.Mrub_07713~~Mrub_07713.p1  ORF type:complete len:275 (+),score=-8.63 Mrub_07713:56-826(+)
MLNEDYIIKNNSLSYYLFACIILFPIICFILFIILVYLVRKGADNIDYRRYLPIWTYLGIANLIGEVRNEEQASCNQTMLENRILFALFQSAPMLIFSSIVNYFYYGSNVLSNIKINWGNIGINGIEWGGIEMNGGKFVLIVLQNTASMLSVIYGLWFIVYMLQSMRDWGSSLSRMVATSSILFMSLAIIGNLVSIYSYWGYFVYGWIAIIGILSYFMVMLMSFIEQGCAVYVFNRNKNDYVGFDFGNSEQAGSNV